MDGISPTPQPPKKRLSIILVGAIIVVLILSTFFVLNYFNILSLSQFFPNQLSWLPHKADEISQNKEETRTRQSFPALSLSSPNDQAKQTLVQFLPTILESSLLATSASDITFIKEEKIDGFTAFWDTKENGTLKVVFTPSSSEESISSLNIALHKTHSEPPSKEVAQTIAPETFLVIPKGEWQCGSVPDSPRLYCENFWEEGNGTRRGVGLLGYHPDSTTKTSTIFFCQFTQESASYSWQSCAPEFAETGLR